MKATINFNTVEQANNFAIAWGRFTLTGHTVSKTKVTVYDVTDDRKAWINNYINNINETDKRY